MTNGHRIRQESMVKVLGILWTPEVGLDTKSGGFKGQHGRVAQRVTIKWQLS